ARRFRGEGHGPGVTASRLLEESHQSGIAGRFKTVVHPGRIDLTCEITIGAPQISNLILYQIQHVIRFLTRNGSPFQREAAFSSNNVLCRTTLDDADVERGVGWIEIRPMIAF